MRLNKFISLSGIASRREADNLVKSAIVTVNDMVETNPAYQVSISDKVKCDEKIISLKENKRIVLLNKPTGFITTIKDPLKRKTVMDLVQTDERLFPIGRLDKDTSGLLLLTNHGFWQIILCIQKIKFHAFTNWKLIKYSVKVKKNV